MNDYSQHGEGKIILDYFAGQSGMVLDIGANDGITFSNSLNLIEEGWDAILIEPNLEAFKLLQELHKDRCKGSVVIPSRGYNPVACFNIAIGTETKTTDIFINNPHLKGDVGLLSTFKEEQKLIWRHFFNNHKKQVVQMVTFKDFVNSWPQLKKIDFITIDVEGMDFEVLEQIDLIKFGVKMVCVETNSVNDKKYIDYMASFGFKIHHKNYCNIIFTK